jgi:hypothetical protein
MLKRAESKLKWSSECVRFEERKFDIGETIERKIFEWCNAVTRRKLLMNEFVMKCANNVKKELQTCNERFEKGLIFADILKYMMGSLKDINNEIVHNNSYEEIMIEWYQKKIDEEYKMKRQFEKGNVFYFSKDVWNKLRERKVLLSFEGIVINKEEFKKIKRINGKGIKLDWTSIRK